MAPSAKTQERQSSDRPHLGKEGQGGQRRSRDDQPEDKGRQASNKAGSGQGARKN